MSEPDFPTLFVSDDSDYSGTINLSTLVSTAETSTGSYDFDRTGKHPMTRLFDAVPMPALLVDDRCKIAFANTACRVMGVRHEDYKAADLSSLFPGQKDPNRVRTLVKQVFGNRKPRVAEGTIGVGDRKIWGRLYFRSLRFENSRLVLVLVQNLTAEKRQQILTRKHQEELQKAHDQLELRVAERTAELVKANQELKLEIAARKEAESSLRSSERRFKAVFETAQDSVFIKDLDRRYTHVNPAMLKRLQLASNQVIARSDDEIFDTSQLLHIRNIEDRVLKGQVIESEHTTTLNGTSMTFSCSRVPMYDTSGKIEGIFGIARDLTERKEINPESRLLAGDYPSSAMKQTLRRLRLAAQTDSLVLLLGESGSGKDHLARMLHDQSNRSGGPFLSINCAALSPELVESELFGHEPGAFTGSRGRKRGLLELAEGGTLVLNEIAELSLQLQAKLLTFLDTQSFIRVGGEEPVSVSARLVAATNRNLEKEVEAGTFRKDLFYRLNVFVVTVPALRERVDDVPLLVKSLLISLSERMGLVQSPEPGPGVTQALANYDWPGNVRELRNVLERAIILSDRKTITVEDLGLPAGPSVRERSGHGLQFSISLSHGVSMDDALRESKRSLVVQALKDSGGSVKDAAELLGITRASLNHHMKYLEIDRSG